MNTYQFKLELAVRDYECDFQGIVNNAVYQNYLEHARHLFIKQCGIDFITLSKQGINLVVVRVEMVSPDLPALVLRAAESYATNAHLGCSG